MEKKTGKYEKMDENWGYSTTEIDIYLKIAINKYSINKYP